MWFIKLIFVFVSVNIVFGRRGHKTIYLGGIFDENSEDEETFRWAVDHTNTLLSNTGVKFVPISKSLTNSDTYETMSVTCEFLKKKAVVIFGPKNEENINNVQSICDYKDIVHVITRWVYQPQHNSVINFYPSADSLCSVYFDIITRWSWKTFTVFYHDNDSLLRMTELVKRAKNAGIQVAMKQLDEKGEFNYRESLKQGLDSGETNFVIDCNIDILEQVLVHAQQVGMMTSNYKYLIANLDLHTVNLEPFQYSDANITGIRLVSPSEEVIERMNKTIEEIETWKTERALLVDAVTIITEAIAYTPTLQDFNTDDLECQSRKSLKHGTSLANDVKTTVYYDRLTGFVEFDTDRFRSNFNLDIMELHEDGIQKIGTWNMNSHLSLTRFIGDVLIDDPHSLRNKNFTVITCLTDPYGMLKESSETLTGNNRFEGYGIDLIHDLAVMEGFNYTFIIREDKANGKKLANGSWSGMIGDIMDGKAHLAITDLTITAEREEAVDFTSPFMSLGISILAKKPEDAPPSFFSFADPFALDTWIMLALAYAVVSISFFILGRLCPDEWTNPYPCIEEPEYLLNQFSFKNSCWFAIGSLMQQGTEVAPIGISTRMLAGMWWFFVLLMVSSYTANLAASLTTENPINLFTDVQTLVENMEKYNIRLGAKANGATAAFFRDSQDKTFKIIAEYFENHPENMAKENKDGVKLAETETYVFFMESTSIEYETERHCGLKKYGDPLDDKGYGIAMKKNSTYRKRLSTAILKLQASGHLEKLKRKWWEERRGGGQCRDAAVSNQAATPLSVKHVEGVLYVTLGGTICAMILVIGNALYSTFKLSGKAKMPFRETIMTEMKANFNLNSDTKAVIKEKSSSKSGSGSTQNSETSNNNLKPRPYGFTPAISVSKEDLAEI